MTIDRTLLLEWLDPQWLDAEHEDALIRRIRTLLSREDTRVVANRAAKVSVSEARRLWMTRLSNTDVTGQTLHGAESLLSRLEGLTQQRKLEQVAFTGPETSGNLFFEGTHHRFVGAVVVDTHASSFSR